MQNIAEPGNVPHLTLMLHKQSSGITKSGSCHTLRIFHIFSDQSPSVSKVHIAQEEFARSLAVLFLKWVIYTYSILDGK